MNKKEAIEKVKELNWSYFDMSEEASEEYLNAIKEVLDIIEKQDLHIEHWKNGFERELESNRTNTLELLDQDQKIKKQEKIIELMARYIAGLDIEEDICCRTEKYGECDQMAYGECEECIKAYFEREAEKC